MKQKKLKVGDLITKDGVIWVVIRSGSKFVQCEAISHPQLTDVDLIYHHGFLEAVGWTKLS